MGGASIALFAVRATTEQPFPSAASGLPACQTAAWIRPSLKISGPLILLDTQQIKE
jgi:hypothetical protein